MARPALVGVSFGTLREAVALLMVEGVGPRRFRELVARFGDPRRVLEAPVRELARVVPRRVAEGIKAAPIREAERALSGYRGGLVGVWEEDYPAALRELPEAPPLLFYIGNIRILGEDCFAVVGTRRPTDYGRRVAREAARALAGAGYTVVSGGALGIDYEAHRGALEAGKTCVVLGSGLMRPYPRENRGLFERVVEGGGVLVSEFLPKTPPEPHNFPKRNRIISGLCKGVLVVEGSTESGAMITARWAMEQGRDVWAVPGPIDRVQSQGPNSLIKEGALVYTGPEDLVGPEPPAVRLPPDLNRDERRILEFLTEPRHVDEIADYLEWSPDRVLGLLLQMELRGLVRQLPGAHYARET